MTKEDLLEEFQNVQYRMDAEGFHYCFYSYSQFQDIKDEEFHRLRKAYLEAAEKLEKYVENKIEELENDL